MEKKLDRETESKIRDNIFYRSQGFLENYNNFDWHKFKGKADSYKPQSSQALGIDVFGCLKLSPLRNELINSFFEIPGESWEIKFEFPGKNILNEPTPTQIDVVIKNNNTVYFVECKFTEAGGSCSQTNKNKTAGNLPQCNGNYELQTNPHPDYNSVERCALTGKGIKYWDYIEKIFNYDASKDYQPCPFKGEEYQWMRNLCFAKAYSEQKHVESNFVVFYFDSDISKFAEKMKDNKHFGKISENQKDVLKGDLPPCYKYRDFVNHCIYYCQSKNHDDERRVWEDLLKWLNKKEETVRKNK